MAYAGGGRRTNPLFAISAVGLFLFGLMALYSTVSRRFKVIRRPPEFERLREEGYGELIPETVRLVETQWVVVTKEPLRRGESIYFEAVELRSAQWVVASFPQLQTPESRRDPKKPLVRGFYEKLDDVVERYVAEDIPAGTPLALSQVVDRSPFANPLDEARRDRITIAMPPEPTLYPLLRPGDRVDVFIVTREEAVRYPIRNVRIVAVNNVLTQESGLVTKEEERQAGAKYRQAAARKRERIMQGREGATETAAPDEEVAEKPPAKAGGGEAGAEGEEEELAEGEFRLGRPFDGRTITLQVTPLEAMYLAMAHRTPGVRLAFALHARS